MLDHHYQHEEDELNQFRRHELEEGERTLFFDIERVRGIQTGQTSNFVKEFADVFSAQEFDALPPHRSWDHAIDLTKDFKVTNL